MTSERKRKTKYLFEEVVNFQHHKCDEEISYLDDNSLSGSTRGAPRREMKNSSNLWSSTEEGTKYSLSLDS